MSSRPLVLAGIVAGVLAAIALFAVALGVVAMDGETLSASTMALLVLGTAVGWVLDATWLCFAVNRLASPDHGGESDEGEGGGGWHRPGPDPGRPSPPSEDPDWWPEFEREFRAHAAAYQATIVDRSRGGNENSTPTSSRASAGARAAYRCRVATHATSTGANPDARRSRSRRRGRLAT